MRAGKIGFRFGDVGTAQQQFRRHAGRDQRQCDAVEVLRLDVETFRRPAEQDGERVLRFGFLLLEHGDVGFLLGYERLFLRQIELRGDAVLKLRLGDHQDALGVFDVLLRERHALAQRQHVEIGYADIGHFGERHFFLRITLRPQCLFGGVKVVARQAPDVRRPGAVGREGEGVGRGAGKRHAAAARGRHEAGGRLRAFGRRIEIDAREQRRALDVGLRLRLENGRERDRDVEVVGFGRGDKPVELGAVEAVPPFLGRPDADFGGDRAVEFRGNVGRLERQRRIGRTACRRKSEHKHRRLRHQFRHGIHSHTVARSGWGGGDPLSSN